MVRPADQSTPSDERDYSDLSDSDEYDGLDENGSTASRSDHEQEYASDWDEPIDVDSVRPLSDSQRLIRTDETGSSPPEYAPWLCRGVQLGRVHAGQSPLGVGSIAPPRSPAC